MNPLTDLLQILYDKLGITTGMCLVPSRVANIVFTNNRGCATGLVIKYPESEFNKFEPLSQIRRKPVSNERRLKFLIIETILNGTNHV